MNEEYVLPGTKMVMIDFEGRRLTGANFFCGEPAALVDVQLPADNLDKVLSRWHDTIEELHTILDRPIPKIGHRLHDKGQSLYFTAPIDALYSAIELSETALLVALGEIQPEQLTESGHQTHVERLMELFEDEARPDLLRLQQQAQLHEVPFLWDDDLVSLGYGIHSRSWAQDELPDPEELDWKQHGKIPLAFITGTNGKSTTTRLCSQILKAANLTAGFSSTDGIWAGENCLDQGDYSGPGGAREVLRNGEVDAAILEVARGGLLRRGVGAEDADVALITNVAEDHLGEYGVNTLEELIEAKFIVRKALSSTGKLVLNADDAGIVNFAAGLDQDMVWYSLDRTNAVIEAQVDRGETVLFVNKNHLCLMTQGELVDICPVNEIPITLNGAARHNISNALAASAVCWQLGIKTDFIREGLITFAGDRHNNPGRGNLLHINNISIMVDFAHNPHGLTAVVDTLLQLPARRRLVMLGHAGDRSDDDIQALTRVAMRLNPELVVIYELEDYLRGREVGEIPRIISDTLADGGFASECIALASNPVAGTKLALHWANEGDFLLLLVLGDRDLVLDLLESRQF
ncbi:MAG: Mur ligase family protein [Gammaproteobacteria bacterium]|nr:Mur ligase family protein [Gammaproteobacteria bacterium]